MKWIIRIGIARITGRIKCQTGLHIGAGKDTVEIGGIDLPVMRHPHTREPYVPGSSLKGKLRFLLEWALGDVRDDGRAWGFDANGGGQQLDPQNVILRAFGSSIPRKDWEAAKLADPGPTRLMVRDAFLDPGWVRLIQDKDQQLTEEKTEVSIDRIAGKALDGGLRRTERVIAGAEFLLDLSFRLYDTGDGGRRDRECLNWVIAGLGLIEQDALGGSGSRGYGRVSFEDLVVTLPDGTRREIGAGHRLNRFPTDQAPSIVSF